MYYLFIYHLLFKGNNKLTHFYKDSLPRKRYKQQMRQLINPIT